MTLPPPTPTALAGQLVAAALFGAIGVYLLLPKARVRSVAGGTFGCLAAAVCAVLFVVQAFGPAGTNYVEQGLFWLFSGGALTFGTVLVTQRNPARGALAFAFVIVSVCGLFLLLAAPFLMAATVIIYAGAVIVTFLFVLMLSNTSGPSSENDRTREPLLGSLAGFGFAGLMLFTLYQSAPSRLDPAKPEPLLPAGPITAADKDSLLAAAATLKDAEAADTKDKLLAIQTVAQEKLSEVVGGDAGPAGRRTVQERLTYAKADPRSAAIVAQADALAARKAKAFADLENNLLGRSPDLGKAKADLVGLRADVLALAGRGELPHRNVAGIGYLLYSEHLLAVELAGTLLLVATVGAVAIAGRKGAVA